MHPGIVSLLLAAALASPQTDKPPASPVGVVRAFYTAANSGQCAEAKQYLAPEALASLGRQADGYERFCRDRAGDAPLEKVSVKAAQIRGIEAEVVSQRHFANGRVAGETLRLAKRDGVWRIVLQAGAAAP